MAETPNLKVRIVPIADSLSPAFERIVDQAAIISALGEVAQEIWSARAEHGKQHDLPLGFNGPESSILDHLDIPAHRYPTNGHLESLAKRLCEEQPEWAHILFEEVAEALAAEPDSVRAELIQVAAMAVGAVLAHDAQR